jgi:2-polyprenyl-3-methyl-5-hydroxy-6-metoxy-1,4-benzoquinol methylase
MPFERIDFARRVEPQDLPEWMDEPCSYEEFRACLADLAQVNRLTLAARPTLRFLEDLWHSDPTLRNKAAKDGSPVPPLRIVDIGFGGGDMLRRIARWAQRRSIAVKLTGIDLNPYAARAAREFTPARLQIEWITGDAFSYTQPCDVVLSSLFTHHLSEPEIVRFLVWMQENARLGWFVNDLVRESTPYQLFSIIAAAAGWHKFVRHDGPVSFRRAFREDDWQRMGLAAGIALHALSVQRWTPGRLCVGRRR